MTSQGRRIAGCHLLLRGNRWMPISVNKALGGKDRCSPEGAVISAYLSAVVEGDSIVGWLGNSAFSVQEALRANDGETSESRKFSLTWA